MTKEEIKAEFVGLIGDVKKIKESLFNTQKTEEPAKVETPEKQAEPAKAEETPVNVEFNHEEFTKSFNEFKEANEAKIKSYEDKFSEAESKLNSFNEVITKQNEVITKQNEDIKQIFTLVEKILATPVAASSQKKSDGAKTTPSSSDWQSEMADWRNKYLNINK